MNSLLFGMYAAALAADGAKHEGENGGFTAAVLIAACIFFNIFTPLRVGNGVYLSLGGALLICLALFAALYVGNIGAKIFTVFSSVLLGILFYLVEKSINGVELSPLNAENAIVYAVFVLTVCAFSADAPSAFAVSVISVNVTSLLFYLQYGNSYIIGGGDTFQISAVIVVFSSIVSGYLRKTYGKLYPNPSALMREMSKADVDFSERGEGFHLYEKS